MADKNAIETLCNMKERCKTHRFQIKPQKQFSLKIEEVSMSFCPMQAGPQTTENTYPQFNKDGNYFTPSFILGVDKGYNQRNNSFELSLFQRKIRRACNPSNELYFPQPSKQKQYCHNCKCKFQNYMSHINSISHSQNIKNSIGNYFIQQFCQLYPQSNKNLRSKVFMNSKNVKPLYVRKEKQKIIYENSTLTTKKQNKQQTIEEENKQKRLGRNKRICKLSPRQMTLRSYKQKREFQKYIVD